jgi:carboxymethylenebutenolidase
MNEKDSQPVVLSPYSYIAKPKSGIGKGVLVLHAWWGLNQFFKDLCNRLAGEGFFVLAPDLYHGKSAATIAEAKKLRSNLKQETIALEITQAADQLHQVCRNSGEGLGVMGFSLGGFWGLWLAEQRSNLVTATVVFYGTRNGDYSACQSAFQFHLAEKDPYESASAVKKLQKNLSAADKIAAFYTYPGTGHWFFESDQPEAYNPQAAQMAWNRSVEFLKLYI